MNRRRIPILISILCLITTGCSWQWFNPFNYFTHRETPYADREDWTKREEQVQIFAVRPQEEQLFFITDQHHYIFPISPKLTAVLQMPLRNRLDVATHRFEQNGDLIKGDLTLSLRLRDAGFLDEKTLNTMGFRRSIEPDLGDVWKLDLYLVGKIYQGITEVPPKLHLNRPYNIHIYERKKYKYTGKYKQSPIQKLAEPLFLLTVPIWFTNN